MKKQIITIAGALGSGKSSTAKRVSAELGYQHFSSGDLFRQIAKERGLTVEEMSRTAETEVSIDYRVDEKLRALGKEDKIVIDSRLAYHWIPSSFKVYLKLDTHTAARRIFNHIQSEGRESQNAESFENLVEATEMRKESERKRYSQLYQIDITDLSPFDLVVDTSQHDLHDVVHIVLEHYQRFLKS